MNAQKIYQFFSNIFDVMDKWFSPLWFLYKAINIFIAFKGTGHFHSKMYAKGM